jgi:hypothetical protein
VLMMRTMQPIPTRGLCHAIVMDRTIVRIGRSSAETSRCRPSGSFTPIRSVSPPTATRTADIQNVTYAPRRGTQRLATNEPSVGNLPVNAN